MRIFAVILSGFLILVLHTGAQGQTCLQLLDSVEYFKDRQKEKTVFYGQSLVEKLEAGECNLDIGITAIYNNVGLALWRVKEQTLAQNAFEKALEGATTKEDSISIDYLDIYYSLSELHSEKGEYDIAGDYLKYADKIVEKEYGARSIENVLHQFRKGIYFRGIGKFNESLTSLSAAEIIGGDIKVADSIMVDILIETGTTLRHFGDLTASEEKLTGAVERAKQISQSQYLQAIDRLSTLKIEQGEYSDSESFLLHNLEIKGEYFADDDILMLETLNGLGMLYYKINDITSAEKYLERALGMTEKLHTIRPYMMNNLAAVYMRQGKTEKALQYFKESAEGFKQLFGSMHPDYASCLNNLASTFKGLGDLSEALNLYMRVLDMDKVIYGLNHPRYATTLNNIALIYIQLDNVSLAGRLLRDSKDIREKTLGKSHPLYMKSMNDLGLYYLIEGDTVGALKVFNEALVEEIQHMRSIFPVLTRQQRQLYFKETKTNVERFCSLAFSESFLDTHWAELALNHFINTKGILFYASDKMRKLIQNSNDQSIQRIYDEWRDIKFKLAQAYLLSEEERVATGTSISTMEQEADALEKKLSLKFKVFSDQEKSEYHEWESISAALPDNSAAIEIIQFRKYKIQISKEGIEQGFEDKSNYAAFILKRDSILLPVHWPRDIDFDRIYNRYTNSLKFGVKDSESFKNFWRPVDEKLQGVQTVYLAPDGVYYKVNPSVFYDEANDEYVSDKYNIVNITSSKDFLAKETKQFIREAKIFGNPNFEPLKIEEKLAQLPGAEREAQDITKLLDIRRWKTESHYFVEATEDKVKALNNPGVVHIATHGYFDDDPSHSEPLNSSGLFLTKTTEDAEDGILSAYEAMNLVLDETNVVVLAACETGLGTVKNGEGVFGLQRAFLVAGADNVLISLVKINDQAARRFMNLYYENLREVEDAQKAFFKARATFKEEDNNPYDWGAYVLVSRN